MALVSIIATAESLARALGWPVRVAPGGRAVCAEDRSFWLDFCAGKVSLIVKGETEKIISAMTDIFGSPKVSRTHVFGVSEYIFHGTVIHPLPPNGKRFLWTDIGGGWEEVRFVGSKAAPESIIRLSIV